MTQKQPKWSESESDYVNYSKIVRKLIKKLNRYTRDQINGEKNDWDLEKAAALAAKVGYCLNIKTSVAHKTDIENRVKYLESINPSKQAHEGLATR
jgi:hypothetical protein